MTIQYSPWYLNALSDFDSLGSERTCCSLLKGHFCTTVTLYSSQVSDPSTPRYCQQEICMCGELCNHSQIQVPKSHLAFEVILAVGHKESIAIIGILGSGKKEFTRMSACRRDV